MAKREKKSTTGNIPTTPASEDLATKRAARRANRVSSGVTTTRASAPSRPEIVQSNRKKREMLTPEQVAYQLAHPTKEVSYEELKTDYAHVVRDIRNMFLLAAVLMVSMVILAQVL